VTRLLQLFKEIASEPRRCRELDADVVVYSAKRNWDSGVREMLDQVAQVERTLARRLLICREDLCDEDTLRAAKLLLVPAPGREALRVGLEALQRQVPLLASQEAWEVGELCRYSNAGLIYADGDELAEGLRLLLTDEPLRRAMGANGLHFIREQAPEIAPRRRS
jgi:glycosyltransferase involved in cell wall biosynthesis